MRRLLLWTVVMACGDNRAAPKDASTQCTPVSGTTVTLRKVVSSCYFSSGAPPPFCVDGSATLVASPPDDPRLFVLEQLGRIRIVDHDTLRAEPFLNIRAGVDPPLAEVSGFAGGEVGLLGLAFHPQYASNRTFFIYYTGFSTDPSNPWWDVVMRFTASASDPNTADLASGKIVLAVPDFAGNHNGGMIEFGPDGYLYVGIGDGGGGNDPQLTGQDKSRLLGKILRIDVDHQDPGKEYAIPADNPFANGGGAPEVFILGVRNPWRYSFDRATGDLWIGDVGQDETEELDVLPAGSQNGANLGWSMYEGTTCFHPPCDPAGLTFAQDNRSHASGSCAIIGGQVYRGTCYPDLRGTYFYSDYCSHRLPTARLRADGSLEITELPISLGTDPASIHADSRGELYLTDTLGNVFRIEAGP